MQTNFHRKIFKNRTNEILKFKLRKQLSSQNIQKEKQSSKFEKLDCTINNNITTTKCEKLDCTGNKKRTTKHVRTYTVLKAIRETNQTLRN